MPPPRTPLVRIAKPWEIPERDATPERDFFGRRTFLRAVGGVAGVAVLGACGRSAAEPVRARQAPIPEDVRRRYPARRNPAYTLDRPLTEERVAGAYNNFYEFGTEKDEVARNALALCTRPWTIEVRGLCQHPGRFDVDRLVREMPLEERLYRHRCVEAWSMAVPWSGFPLAKLVEFAQPKTGAKFLRMETLADKGSMPGLKEFWYPWPYIEGLTIEEATNELAFIATGLYGKPIPPQNGAMLRLATPWKYGFKSIKSIVKFTFTDERPKTFWETLAPNEYGFWANVHPAVRHPRWSQAAERVLGTDEMMETLPFNGYEEFVANLYPDYKNDPKLFM